MPDFDDDGRRLLKENAASNRSDMIKYGLAAVFMLGIIGCVTWVAIPIISDIGFENPLSISLAVVFIVSVVPATIATRIFTTSWRDWRAARKELKKLQK